MANQSHDQLKDRLFSKAVEDATVCKICGVEGTIRIQVVVSEHRKGGKSRREKKTFCVKHAVEVWSVLMDAFSDPV